MIKGLRFLFVLVVILGIVGPVTAETPERTVIGYVNVMDDAPVHVAYEAGLYAQYGLDVELVRFSSGTDLIKGIVTGSLDVGVLGFTNALSWASRGADLKIIGGAQRGYHSILVRKDRGITGVSGLRGRSLASQKQGSTADVVLSNVVLPDADLTKRDLTMRYVSPAVAVQSLVAGGVDAAFLFEPYARIAQYTAPVEEIYEIGDHWPFPCMVVITSGETWRQDRSRLEAVLEAQKDAIEILTDNPQQAARLISHYFIQGDTLDTPQGPVPAVQVIEEAVRANTFNWQLTAQDIDRIYQVEGIMRRENLLSGAVNLDEILDLSWQQARE